MKSLSIVSQKFDCMKALNIMFFATMMISCMLNGANVRAATVTPPDYHVDATYDKYTGTSQAAVAFKMRPPRRLWGKRTEHIVGAVLVSLNRQTQRTGETS